MLSPSELLSFIESLVKTWRAIKDYSELDDSHKTIMKRCIENSRRLESLLGYVRDPSYYSESTWEYINELVADSHVAIHRALTIALEWKSRLGISDRRLGSRAWRLVPSILKCSGKRIRIAWKKMEKEGERKPDWDSDDAADAERHFRLRMAKVPDKTGNEKATTTKRPSYAKERFSEAVYLAVGKRELTSAVEELERLLECLNFAILTSVNLPLSPSETQKTPDILNFVARARNRRDSAQPVDYIDGEHIDDWGLSDIDTDARTGIFYINSGPYSRCIVDPRDVSQYGEHNMEHIALEETQGITRLLAEDTESPESQLSPAAGILPSCGYTILGEDLHAIIFRFPPGCTARTLRHLLIEGTVRHSLNGRVDFAIRLATSVLVVHSLGLVHKNIKPDSILVTESMVGDPEKLYPYKLGKPYLLSFDSSRSSRGPTARSDYPYPRGANWETLYTHPRHFGWRQYKSQMRDDIFSLGVCLLEVALWKSFFRWNTKTNKYEDNNEVVDLTADRMRREARAQGKPDNVDKTWLRHYILIQTAKDLVPTVMGELFKDVIVACLTFGDPFDLVKTEAFESKFEDFSHLPPDEQSVRFVQQVLTKLRSILLS